MSYGISRRVVWQKFTDVSDVLFAPMLTENGNCDRLRKSPAEYSFWLSDLIFNQAIIEARTLALLSKITGYLC